MIGLRHTVSPAGWVTHPPYAMGPQLLRGCPDVATTRNAIVGRQNLPPPVQVGDA